MRLLVNKLKEDGIKQANISPKTHKPWGWYVSLVSGNGFQVKRILVKPGESLSLQSHKYRSEHWVVVAGVATVTIGVKVKNIKENESVFIPKGVKHRLKNQGEDPMELIEVQTGSYLGEDDITRFEDFYARK